MRHYQDDPDFIGPRLPEDHPAYRAHLVHFERMPVMWLETADGEMVAVTPMFHPTMQRIVFQERMDILRFPGPNAAQ